MNMVLFNGKRENYWVIEKINLNSNFSSQIKKYLRNQSIVFCVPENNILIQIHYIWDYKINTIEMYETWCFHKENEFNLAETKLLNWIFFQIYHSNIRVFANKENISNLKKVNSSENAKSTSQLFVPKNTDFEFIINKENFILWNERMRKRESQLKWQNQWEFIFKRYKKHVVNKK
jgi:hypothetical protein